MIYYVLAIDQPFHDFECRSESYHLENDVLNEEFCEHRRTLYRLKDGHIEPRKRPVRCWTHRMVPLCDDTVIVLNDNGTVDIGDIHYGQFEHRDDKRTDFINQLAPIQHIEYCMEGYDHEIWKDTILVIDRAGCAWWIQCDYDRCVSLEPIPTSHPVTSGVEIEYGDMIVLAGPVGWKVGLHEKLPRRVGSPFRALLLSFQRLKMNFVLFLHVAELI